MTRIVQITSNHENKYLISIYEPGKLNSSSPTRMFQPDIHTASKVMDAICDDLGYVRVTHWNEEYTINNPHEIINSWAKFTLR